MTALYIYIGIFLTVLLTVIFLMTNVKMQMQIELTSIQTKLRIDFLYSWPFRTINQQFFVEQEYLINLWDSYFKLPLDDELARVNWYRHLINKLKFSYGKLSSLFSYYDYVVIKKISWISNIGLEEVDKTGFYTGGLWAFKGMCLSLISKKSRLSDLRINVKPDFSNQVFNSQFSCIFSIRMVHIIFISMRLLLTKIRGYYRGNRQTTIFKSPYRSFDANGHG